MQLTAVTELESDIVQNKKPAKPGPKPTGKTKVNFFLHPATIEDIKRWGGSDWIEKQWTKEKRKNENKV